MVSHGLTEGRKYTMQTRENALNEWLKTIVGNDSFTVTPLAGDASFRRYFRLHSDGVSRVIMDAPPNKEDIAPFIRIGHLLANNGIHTPHIYAVNNEQGFILLEDLGDHLLLSALSEENVDSLYTLAIDTLVQLQSTPANDVTLPAFDKSFMLGELNVFREWFISAYLNISLTTEQEQLLDRTFDWLTTQISNQPNVLIHRDYHSRNLIILENSMGVIDFQDAMYGPYSYDLVSLLKDCYIQWPHEKVMSWLAYFHQCLPATARDSLDELSYAFDLCGLQRHLKVLGVFCRLHLRDKKSAYLKDLPLTFNYVMSCLERHESLLPFYQFMQHMIQLPSLEKEPA